MASKEELDAAIKAKGDEIRALKTAKAEKDAIMPEVAKLNVSVWPVSTLSAEGGRSTRRSGAHVHDARCYEGSVHVCMT